MHVADSQCITVGGLGAEGGRSRAEEVTTFTDHVGLVAVAVIMGETGPVDGAASDDRISQGRSSRPHPSWASCYKGASHCHHGTSLGRPILT